MSPPVMDAMTPCSMSKVTGSSISVPSQLPSITKRPFIVPSRGMMNTFPAGRFMTIFGRLQIPLSSKFHSRHATSKVSSVPLSERTFTMRLRLSRLGSRAIRCFTNAKSADIPPPWNISAVMPGIVTMRAPSARAVRTARVWVSE